MSEGKDGGNLAGMVNEGEGGVDVPPAVNEDQGGVAVPPMVNEGQGMEHVSPVMSYEKGTDHIEPVISEGEIRYEGKRKSRSESFSHLPAQDDSAPSTAPTTRPVSQTQADSAPSTAPTTRPVSQTQADSGPITGQGGSAAIAAQDESSHLTAHRDSAPAAAQSAPPDSSAQGESAPIAAQSTLPTRNQRVDHDCGCADIYDHTGKKRQQACDLHRLNPNRSVLPLPPKKPLSEVTNLSGGTRGTSVFMPQTMRTEESPPRQPPVVTPTKGRNFVQGSENGPTFLDPFNSERAIEPTGPPNTLTTIPTQEDKPLKKSTGRVSGPKASGPKASGPKALDPAKPRTTQDPPHFGEGASGSQATQPPNIDAVAGEDLGSKAPADEQRTGENAASAPRKSESSEDNDDGGTRLSDEHRFQFTVKEGKKSVGTASGPAFRKGNVQPKSILKKIVGTTAALRKTERGRPPSEQANNDVETEDKSGGARLFHDAAGRNKAGEGNSVTNNASGPVREDQGGAPIPTLILHTDAGPIRARTNSNGEPVFVAPEAPTNGDEGNPCKRCVLM
ncbi:hypothetical protein HO173_007285 [Letharia columbiana]|uniref:Uncharacterized protein n=1 Tax=Letharia columbiana TaxID=112416 RepID=A0A8H6L407_9LECA|nr:uncharacterized protein HO173_007285 [Letharia columbiana]KAF6234659.1 hypothetical protein HO173_007285 [Letharia columbiana]